MPSRRSHTNSHHGCAQCKQRRVKCDQAQPKCGRCSKKDQECTYRHLLSSYDPFRHYNSSQDRSEAAESTSPETSPFSSDSQDPECQESSLALIPTSSLSGLPDMDRTTKELLHHYNHDLSPIVISSTSRTDTPFFHAAILRHYISNPYVYHSLLTLSALHLAFLTSPFDAASSSRHHRLLVTALAHKAAALKTLAPAVGAVSKLTCEPALAASGLLTACAYALPMAGAEFDPIDLMAQISALVQGTTALFRRGWRHPNPLDLVTAPKLRQFVLVAVRHETPWPQAEEAAQKVIQAICSLDEEDDAGKHRKMLLLEAAQRLPTAFRRSAADPCAFAVAIMWLGIVGSSFVDLFRQHDHLAMILFANWSICLKDVSHIWWVKGWPGWIVNAVWNEVGEEERDLLAWARHEADGTSDKSTRTLPTDATSA